MLNTQDTASAYAMIAAAPVGVRAVAVSCAYSSVSTAYTGLPNVDDRVAARAVDWRKADSISCSVVA
jgi:hypothetical protein